jgi:hypothetical protein
MNVPAVVNPRCRVICYTSKEMTLPAALIVARRSQVWLTDGQWIGCDHEAGVDTDEPELAAMVRDSVGGSAISFEDNPGL